jgi:hypothetical protein
MTEAQVMTRLRHELLTAMYQVYPRPLSLDVLVVEVQLPFLTRDKAWLIAMVRAQLDVLNHAGLVRPASGGYLLTEKGRRDRQQAARFFPTGTTTPPDAA